MLKINKIVLCVLTLSNCMYAKISFPPGITTQDLKNKKIEFAWDIHETLCQKNKGEIAGITLTHLPTIIGNIGMVRSDIKKIKKENEYAAGEAYAEHFRKKNKPKIAQFIEKIANAYKPTKGIVPLLHELSSKGYTHRLASNIGKKHLAILNNRLIQKFKCPLFGHMNGGTIIDYGLPIHAVRSITKEPLSYAKQPKPHNDLYKTYNQTYNGDNSKIIIFIDDKIKNIEAANRNGWIGIHFTTTKKLRIDLQELGILS